ncbi:MAG: ATP-binding cassette domain-containing protein [Betaproteobacteria bacterium]|nr:ATP-binding cassette domain-containing protein [Betaproteobacteria bacterium]
MDASKVVTLAPKIRVRSLGKIFEGPRPVVALEDINLDVQDNEFVTLVGASGCGKSTLLRIIGGLEYHTSGEVIAGGRAISGPGSDRAMVFQHYSLYPWLNVIDNIRFSRRLRVNREDLTSADVERASGRADALLNLMGLPSMADAFPSQLSGGMQQRVAIARALMPRPEILLMDEPFGALDAQTREVMHDLILHVFRLEKSTIVFVTHDVEEAIYLGQRVVLLAPRPGRIDTVYKVPFGAGRRQELKHTREFLDMKKEILERIRETSGMKTDTDLLERMSRAAGQGEE